MSTEDEKAMATAKANREKHLRNVISQIVAVVNEHKVPLRRLVNALGGLPSVQKGVPVETKFHDPVTGKKWSGRGKLPNWLKDKNPEDYRIR